MADDLVKRLRDIQGQAGLFASAAADRIEQLERELEICRMAHVVMENTVADAEARLAKVIAAFRVGMMRTHDDYTHEAFDALLVEIEGGKRDE